MAHSIIQPLSHSITNTHANRQPFLQTLLFSQPQTIFETSALARPGTMSTFAVGDYSHFEPGTSWHILTLDILPDLCEKSSWSSCVLCAEQLRASGLCSRSIIRDTARPARSHGPFQARTLQGTFALETGHRRQKDEIRKIKSIRKTKAVRFSFLRRHSSTSTKYLPGRQNQEQTPQNR